MGYIFLPTPIPSPILIFFLQPLFEHESDLEAYRTYRPIDHSGRRYPKFCDLSLEAESLITGVRAAGLIFRLTSTDGP